MLSNNNRGTSYIGFLVTDSLALSKTLSLTENAKLMLTIDGIVANTYMNILHFESGSVVVTIGAKDILKLTNYERP